MAFFLSGINAGLSGTTWIARCKLACIQADLFLKNNLLQAMRWICYKKTTTPVNKILIFRTGSLGDNICAIPAIAAIRRHYPQAQITILANAGAANLVSMENILDPAMYDTIIDYFGMNKRQLFHSLKTTGFDLVIQLPQREATFVHLARDLVFFSLMAKTGWGWNLSTARYFRQTQEKYISFLNETETLLNILRANGISEIETLAYPLNITQDNECFVANVFKEHQLKQKKIIAVVVGAKRPQNRWPVAYFKVLVQAFADEYTIILIGGKEDASLVARLEEVNGVINFCGQFTPIQSAIALKKCILTISNDTGPMHLSYAVGTPVIAIFSSRDFPGRWYPPKNANNIVFRTPNVPCSLCLSDTCNNNVCMQAIMPHTIIKAVSELLARIPVEKWKISA